METSSGGVAPVPSSSDLQTTDPELDLKKLQELPSEQQDFYLLTYICTLTKHVLNLTPDDCTAQQSHIKKVLLQILNLPAPAPSRLIRNNLGRCFAHILGKGDRKLLFESINDLIGIIAGTKGKDGESKAKHTAVHCLGSVYAAAGDSAIGLHPLTCIILLKALKSAQGHAGLRAAIYTTLGSMAQMLGASLDEAMAKDIWKSARNAATSDKSALVQITACRCLCLSFKHTPYFEYGPELDALKAVMWKVMDSGSPSVRKAASNCLAEALVKTHSEVEGTQAGVAKIRPLKRVTTKRQSLANDDEEIPRPQSPSLKKTRVTYTIEDLLRQLSTQYVRSSSTSRLRAGIALCYCRVLRLLKPAMVEVHYLTIVDHLTSQVLSSPNIFKNRHKLLVSRRFVQIILEDIIGGAILGEAGRLYAARLLVDQILKNYPQALPERPEPSKHTLIATLSALTALITNLGPASNSIIELCRDALLQTSQHPSYSVQVYVARCLRTLTSACPQQLLSCLTICLNSTNRELGGLSSGRNAARRCVGYANALAAMLHTASMQPLYGSVEIYSRILSLATSLLKSSGQSDLRVSCTQIQVAWVLMGGLMCLGANFVKIHLSQLMLLWKNALPKPLARDNTVPRSHLELSFLTHVRECALGSILAFLWYNTRLLTADVSKRIAGMLQNTLAFLRTLPSRKVVEDTAQRLSPAIQLIDLDLMVQRRILQCYNKLIVLNFHTDNDIILHSDMLALAISCFADPEKFTSNSLSSSIANSAGSFESVWEAGDNSGFGITTLVRGFDIVKLDTERFSEEARSVTCESKEYAAIARVLASPICSSLDHDSLCLYVDLSPPEPPATEIVDAAIQLFGIAFPQSASKIQESILEQVITFTKASILQRELGRQAALEVNIATALYMMLKIVARETSCPAGDISSIAVERLLQTLLRSFATHEDHYVRNIGCRALARLCTAAGTAFTNTEIKFLIDTIVMNREPHVRAGCATALGKVHSQVGGMSAGFHLKTILGVLMSLCNDAHPTVHYWALEALAEVTESAGLTFSGYVSSTLGMIAQLYITDTHNEEVASPQFSNLEIELPTVTAICRCIDSAINVLGPDLQDVIKSRELILSLLDQFRFEGSPSVLGVTLKCFEHFSLYAPGHLDFATYVNILQTDLRSNLPGLRDSAVDGLYNLMKRNPTEVIEAADVQLEDDLWLILDAEPEHEGVQNLLTNWLHDTVLLDTVEWIDRLLHIFTMMRVSSSAMPTPALNEPALPDLQDEEVASFAGPSKSSKTEANGAIASGQEPLRWQVRTFAMQCLNEMIQIIKDAVSTQPENSVPSQDALQQRIADIVRMAFSASTTGVVELRIAGLRTIEAILQMFGRTPDPDFLEASLLEQYQAQIASAITPAFAADSSPELASQAIAVCASFISTGIVKEVDRLGRILKTLVSALERFSTDADVTFVGDLKGLTSNAQVMIRMAVLSAWAELQVASLEQEYLQEVLKPHIGSLTPGWLASLREFARLRFEPDISMSLGPAPTLGSLDTVYSAMNRETLLQFYQASWLQFVNAIASLIGQDCDFVFDALDGKGLDAPATNSNSHNHDINYRDEPVAFFFVLYGITFEALMTKPSADAMTSRNQTGQILKALRRILQPSVSGQAIYRDAIFSETVELLSRLALTEGPEVQHVVVTIVQDLCRAHPAAIDGQQSQHADLSDDIDQLFELTRIIVVVLKRGLPCLGRIDGLPREQTTSASLSLTRSALEAMVDASEAFPAVIKTDLHACLIHIFATIMETPSCQAEIAPQSLPIMRRFMAGIADSMANFVVDTAIASSQMLGCLARFVGILLKAQKREKEFSLSVVKNILLASTILLNTEFQFLSTTEPLVVRFLDVLIDCLLDRMTAKVACSCIRSFLLTGSPGAAIQSICAYLLPRIVNKIVDGGWVDTENVRFSLIQTLVTNVGPTRQERIDVAVPTLLPLLLQVAKVLGDVSYTEVAARLLDLAAKDQAMFKSSIQSLETEQRALLGAILSMSSHADANWRAQQSIDDQTDRVPAIALKMFGE